SRAPAARPRRPPPTARAARRARRAAPAARSAARARRRAPRSRAAAAPGPPRAAAAADRRRSSRTSLEYTRDILAPMARERPPGYADRLPRVVPKEEADISALSDEMAELLYPGRRPRPFRVGLRFDTFEGPGLAPALELARRSPEFRESTSSEGTEYHAA